MTATIAAPRLTGAGCAALHRKAAEAGAIAAAAATPAPIRVVERANPLDDTSPVIRESVISGGICGRAYVVLRPATSAFARWLKANVGARKGYYGGLEISTGLRTQSLEVHEAFASAYAEVLAEAGFSTYVRTWID